MARRAEFSAQALLVLAALCAEPRGWRHGYGIARDRAEVGHAVPDLDQAGRPWPGRGALGGGAAGAAVPAPVPADPGGLASAGAALADTPAPVGAGTRRRDGRGLVNLALRPGSGCPHEGSCQRQEAEPGHQCTPTPGWRQKRMLQQTDSNRY